MAWSWNRGYWLFKIIENGAVRSAIVGLNIAWYLVLVPFWVIWRWIIIVTSFKLVPFEILCAVSYSTSIVTMALSCIISDMKHIGRKSWFFIPPLHSTPPLRRGWAPSEYWRPVWYGKKLERYGYATVKKLWWLYLAVLSEYRRVTDGPTDKRTDRRLATA